MVPVDEMARVLKPCRSTIIRELKRNHFSDESLPIHRDVSILFRPDDVAYRRQFGH